MAIIIIALGFGIFFYLRSHHAKPAATTKPSQHYFPASITSSQINIPVYYPIGLPSGFSVGSFSVIKQNVLYYVVTNATGDKFFITVQPLPADFDFVSFAKKFPQPDQYNTPIGTNLVGVAGGDLIGSIQTNQNVWIILNASGTSSIKDMETITRALRQVSL